MSCSRISSRAREVGRGLVAALLGVLLVLSCKDHLSIPPDTAAPAAVIDLHSSTVTAYYVELAWTASGDDGANGTASSCELRYAPGAAITTEAQWEAATAPSRQPDAVTAGQDQQIRVDGLEPETIYGFALRYTDDNGNRGPLSNPLTVRTAVRPPEDAGRVLLHLRSRHAEGYLGTRIEWGDSVLVASAADSSYEFALPDGEQTIRLTRACSVIDPETAQAILIEPRTTKDLIWTIDAVGTIQVTSAPPGAEVLLNGASTGSFTPAELNCLTPGPNEFKLRWGPGLAAGPDSVQLVTVDADPHTVSFAGAAVSQPRTALLEIFTATFCPNCGPADAAAALLWNRIGPEQGYIGIQIHTRWGGQDSIKTAATLERNTYYGDQERLGIPAAIFGGTLVRRGAGQMTTEEIADVYAEYVDSVRAVPTPVSLYWLDAVRTPGTEVVGHARVVLSGPLDAPGDCHLWAAVYKDSLRTRGIEGPDQLFRHNVRTYLDGGSLASLSVEGAGEFADVEFRWDSSVDTRRLGALWSEAQMGIVVFVQNMQTKEILQAAHAPLP